MKYSLAIVLGASLKTSQATSNAHASPLSLASFNSILSSESNSEYAESEELFSRAAEHEWKKHASVTQRRALKTEAEDPSNDVEEPRFPYVVCENTPDIDGFR